MLTSGNQTISIYIHIPFCRKKCPYCHFYVIPDKGTDQELLLKGLKAEWERRIYQLACNSHRIPRQVRQDVAPDSFTNIREHCSCNKARIIGDEDVVTDCLNCQRGCEKCGLEGKGVCSIYFGGGTPSLLEVDKIGEILEWFRPYLLEEAEITIEANPEDITYEKMLAFSNIGINRVSIGVQSLQDQLLKVLGRQHNAKRAVEAVEEVSRANISNITIDLMYEIPEQTIEQWQKTLILAVQLPITHISLYNLTIEPQTIFYKNRKKLERKTPKNGAEMYIEAIEYLTLHHFNQYEISAFAKDGQISKHNVGYWTGRPFLGFGPSAFSYWEGKRFRNVANIHRYMKQQNPIDFEEELTPQAKNRELFAINLRLLEGVEVGKYQVDQQEIDKLISRGFLRKEEGKIKLTKQGILFYDTVASELI